MPTALEPTFLAERRRQAAELATGLKLPAKTDEAWRRTALDGLDVAAYTPAAPSTTYSGNLPDGVIFTDIVTAAAQYPELVGKYLGTQFAMSQNLLTAAQAANLNGGAFLYVPKNTEVTEPVLVEYNCKAGEACYLHTLVIAEANASVTLLEKYSGEGEYLHVGVAEVFPQDGARIRYGYLQNHGEDAWSFFFRRGATGRDATLDWVGGEFGGGLVRSELMTDVSGEGSNSTVKVVYGAADNQHIDIVASEVHTGNNSHSDILGRGVVQGKAHTVFRGNGLIRSGSRGSATRQRQETLLLSDKARADAIPALIIDEYDVEGAGHAATIGKLDEEQLFYLMARGLSRQQATQMLVMAFLTPVLDKIPVASLRDEMSSLMAEKVNG